MRGQPTTAAGIQKKAAGLGTMLAVGLWPEEAARRCCAEHEAACRSPPSTARRALTLAGEAESLAAIAAELERQGVFNRFLQVEVAYHSPYMDPLAAGAARVARAA